MIGGLIRLSYVVGLVDLRVESRPRKSYNLADLWTSIIWYIFKNGSILPEKYLAKIDLA